MILPIILAGGTGKRLWPLSRDFHPKQFHSFFSQHSLLQNTLRRIKDIEGFLPPIVICNEACYEIAKEQTLSILEPLAILVEPVGRNTAPAAVLAALYAQSLGMDADLLILPSDQYISDADYLVDLIQRSQTLLSFDKLVTFGIHPDKPHTGYGYIKVAEKFLDTHASVVQEFVEKPDLTHATQYFNAGNYCWNSGIFLFKTATLLEEAQQHVPAVLTSCQQAFKHRVVKDDVVFFAGDYLQTCPDISIDNAIMEKTENAVMVRFTAAWADLGDWKVIWQMSEKDEENNAIKGDVTVVNTENSYVHSYSRPVITIGLKNTIVLETSHGLLVADLEQSKEVKKVLENLTKKAHAE